MPERQPDTRAERRGRADPRAADARDGRHASACSRASDWALEWKWDGIRVLARVEGGGVRLAQPQRHRHHRAVPRARARCPRSSTATPSSTARSSRSTPRAGPTSVGCSERMGPHQAARDRPRSRHPCRFACCCSTCSRSTARSVMAEPYRARRARLAELVRRVPGVPVEVPPAAEGTPAEALDESRLLGLEGIVAKRPGSPYRPGARTDDWVKLKLTRTQEVVIGGYRRGSARARAASARCSWASPVRGRSGSSTRGGSGRASREKDLDRLLATFTEPSSRMPRSATCPRPTPPTRSGCGPSSSARSSSAAGRAPESPVIRGGGASAAKSTPPTCAASE